MSPSYPSSWSRRPSFHLLTTGRTIRCADKFTTVSKSTVTLLTELRERLAGPAFRELFDAQSHPGVAKTELGFVLKMFLRHRTLVIDLSLLRRYERQQGALISYLLKQVLTDRLDQRDQSQRAVKIVIDEAHRYLPTTDQELSRNGIFQLLREGQKVNLQLILTT